MEIVRVTVLCVIVHICFALPQPRVGDHRRVTSVEADTQSVFNITNRRTRNADNIAAIDDSFDTDGNPPAIAYPKSPDFCTDCVCGAGRKTRIVGGDTTSFHEYPWMVGLVKEGKFHCGGSLITRRHVLTAAHCLEGFNKRYIDLYMGTTDISQKGPHAIRRKIKSWTLHKDFNGYNLNNDIAIIELDRSVHLEEQIKTACLPENRAIDYTGSLATAVGWGRTEEGGEVSNYLRRVRLPVLSDEECNESNYPKTRRTDNMFCAGYLDGERDSCSGDSGGPLLAQAPGGHLEVIGITSFGRGCARPRYPGVYTKVTNYLGWLRDQLNGECICPSPSQL